MTNIHNIDLSNIETDQWYKITENKTHFAYWVVIGNILTHNTDVLSFYIAVDKSDFPTVIQHYRGNSLFTNEPDIITSIEKMDKETVKTIYKKSIPYANTNDFATLTKVTQ